MKQRTSPLHPNDLEHARLKNHIEICILGTDCRIVCHRSSDNPCVHNSHRLANRFQGNAQTRQFIAHPLVYRQRLRNLPCRLQGAEASGHLLVAFCRQNAMAKLGQRHHADRNPIGELTERAFLLPGDEDRGIEDGLDDRSRCLQLIGRIRECSIQLDRQGRIGLRGRDQVPRPGTIGPRRRIVDRDEIGGIAAGDRYA